MPNTPKRKLDCKRMIDAIADLVETDFCFDMDCKAIHPEQTFTHEESTKMRDILMQIYSIAHCRTCTACQGKWLSLPNSKKKK